MNRTVPILGFALFAVLLMTGQRGVGQSMKPIDSISGASLNVIHAALPKFEEKGLKLDKYVVKVFEQESSFVVVFDDPNRPAGQRGSSPNLVGYEVEVSKQGLAVARANFMR